MNTEPTHVTQSIDAYLAGGLDEAEMSAFDAHVADCPPCALALEAARLADAKLTRTLAGAKPEEGFEERVLETLRPAIGGRKKGSKPSRWRVPSTSPLVRRAAVAAAAAIVISAVGYGAAGRLGDDPKQTASAENKSRTVEQTIIPEYFGTDGERDLVVAEAQMRAASLWAATSKEDATTALAAANDALESNKSLQGQINSSAGAIDGIAEKKLAEQQTQIANLTKQSDGTVAALRRKHEELSNASDKIDLLSAAPSKERAYQDAAYMKPESESLGRKTNARGTDGPTVTAATAANTDRYAYFDAASQKRNERSFGVNASSDSRTLALGDVNKPNFTDAPDFSLTSASGDKRQAGGGGGGGGGGNGQGGLFANGKDSDSDGKKLENFSKNGGALASITPATTWDELPGDSKSLPALRATSDDFKSTHAGLAWHRSGLPAEATQSGLDSSASAKDKPAGVTAAGTGTLSLATDSNYTGVTTVTGGVVATSDSSNLTVAGADTKLAQKLEKGDEQKQLGNETRTKAGTSTGKEVADAKKSSGDRVLEAEANFDPTYFMALRAKGGKPGGAGQEQASSSGAQRVNTVEGLTETARKLTREGKYKEAAGVVDQLAQVDPKNDYALGVRPLLEDKATLAEQQKLADKRDGEASQQLNKSGERPTIIIQKESTGRDFPLLNTRGKEEKKIADDDILRHPADWPDVSKVGKPVAERRQEIVALAEKAAADKSLSKEQIRAINDRLIEKIGVLDQAEQNAIANANSDRTRLESAREGERVQTDANKGNMPNVGPSNVAVANPVPKPGEVETPKPEEAAPEKPGPIVHPEAPKPVPERPKTIERKIIRNGNVQFEVDSFDSALTQIGKIVQEEGGFISTTDSEKLPNGRVRGSITLRCPPDRLDTLVLKLRGLGDLKNQKIVAEDVTKRYTDTESQLRAGRAMEERLLAIIKAGGQVKDLLEAEKQLGVWREKIEVLQGEINYLNSQVSLSTLVVEMMERDVRAPTSAAEQETVNTSVESEDVEKGRAEVIKAVEAAKGRVLDSQMTKFEGGQLSATIVAEVAPDAAGPVIDRLKQIGKVARMDVSRKTTTQGGVGPIIPGLRVEKRETRFQVSIYNLAKVAPRQTATLTLAAADVEAVYKAILDQTAGFGGTIVSSNLSRPRADQMLATIKLEVPSEKADAASVAIRAGVDVMQLTTQTSEDRDNVTDAKRGFSIEIRSLAQVMPRETTTLQIAAADVPKTFTKLLDAAKAGGGRILTSQLNEQDPNNLNGTIDFEVSREKWPAAATALADAGLTVSRAVNRSSDTETTVDSKVRLSVTLIDDLKLTPRESIAAKVATQTVPDVFATLASAAKEAGAKQVGSYLDLNDRNNPNGRLNFAVPRDSAPKFETALKAAGLLVSRAVNRTNDGPMTVDTKIGFVVDIVDEMTLDPREAVTATVATKQVADAYAALAAAARDNGARAVGSNLNLADKARPVGRIRFTVPKENAAKFETALREAGLVIGRTVNRLQDGPLVVDTKFGFDLTVVDERTLIPRESQTMRVVTRAVTDRYAKLLDTLRLVDAQVTNSRVVQESKNSTVGVLEFVIRREDRPSLEKAMTDNADVLDRTVERSQDVQGTVDSRIGYRVELRDADQQKPRQNYDLSAEVADVEKSITDLEALALTLGGRTEVGVRTSNRGEESGDVVIDVPLARAGEAINLIRGQGRLLSTHSSRDDTVVESTFSRARLKVSYKPVGTVRTERGLGDSIREGLSTSLAGLFSSLKYLIIGLLLIGPWLLVLWVVVKILRRKKKVAAA